MKREIKVTLKTITPLWTGDAWGENREIRPSSIMGSLRFWFEVICYFAEITDNNNYKDGKLKDEVDEEKFKKKSLVNGNDFKGVDTTLSELGISLPSKIFGCTGWKGWIRIKDIKPIEDYCFGNSLNLPYRFCILKSNHEIKEERNYPKRSNDSYSVWYCGIPYFWGKFGVVFEIEERILEPVFYPLLTFMEKYGLWGGKWNLGYGRLKVEKIERKQRDESIGTNWKKNEFNFSIFNGDFKDKVLSIEEANNFNQLEQVGQKGKGNKIIYLPNQASNTSGDKKENIIKNLIEDLIKIKSQQRVNHKNKVKDNELRHLLFGTVKRPPDKKDLPQGTKIIPWIYEESGQLKGGFISIAGILNLGR